MMVVAGYTNQICPKCNEELNLCKNNTKKCI